ncbi:ROK family protein [Dichotomicrobium thermohalophilum]|uniref:Glucokinase n=1 Tax=Dichotomicrobium thermohalophilum TaxID=933063 RepID=A0A397Q140_9HYPH|nr:ROK family protein [Dichotomicrobium thermohalophilum]RIA55116.1 glucokinase [Dichotomicrobium thermohalophilum]
MTATSGALRLVADVGGTNARFALARPDGRCETAANLRVADFPEFDDALATYVQRLDRQTRERIASAAFAAAGPVEHDVVRLTNAPWQLAAPHIADQLGGVPTAIFNDLQAVALALPFLGHSDVAEIGPVPRYEAEPPDRMVAVNVGTGFGAATAIPAGDGWTACPSEAGHMSLPAANAEEAELLAALSPGRAATLEDVLSGSGVGALYAWLSGGEPIAADAVFARVDADPTARRTVEMLSRWLGRASGDLVLATAAWGGAFLLGGVVSGWYNLCNDSAFRAAFEDKGKMRARMGGVFSGVVTRQDVALLGLAKAPVAGV